LRLEPFLVVFRSRGKYDRHARDSETAGNSRVRDNWEPDRRGDDSKRYQGRDERHYNKDRAASPAGGRGGRDLSPSPRSSSQPGGRRVKDSSGKFLFSGGNAVRIRQDHRDKYPRPPHGKGARERDRSPRERLLPTEAVHRDRISRERERSPRERLLPPEALQQDRYSRERSPRDKYPPPQQQQNRFSRERERGGTGAVSSRERAPLDRASPFERLGHHPLSGKRWESDAQDRDVNRFQMFIFCC
jgi:hypothetical protein